MTERYDFHDALIQIEMLFQSHILSFGYKEYSLETYADRKSFSAWKGREGCADTDAMRMGLNIDGILREPEPSDNEVLTYLQYTLNIAELCRRSFNRTDHSGYDFDIRNYTELLSKIREVLNVLGYTTRYADDREFIFLVPKDPAADALLEHADSPESAAIAEYKSFGMKGKLADKRKLLFELGEQIETFDDNYTEENSRLYRRIRFLLNYLHISGSDSGHPAENEHTAAAAVLNEGADSGVSGSGPDTGGEDAPSDAAGADAMTDGERENWYDTTYQLMLLRILGHASEDQVKKVNQLAEDCGIEEDEAVPILRYESAAARVEAETDVTSPETADGEQERPASDSFPAEVREREEKPHVVRNIVITVVIADIVFMLFLAFYAFAL